MKRWLWLVLAVLCSGCFFKVSDEPRLEDRKVVIKSVIAAEPAYIQHRTFLGSWDEAIVPMDGGFNCRLLIPSQVFSLHVGDTIFGVWGKYLAIDSVKHG